jgi:four helix bundle protein
MLTNFRTYHLAVELYQQCEQLKPKAHMRDQLMRASLSVVLNLAEGSAKPSEKERARFYSIALASCRETQALLTLMREDSAFKLADQIGGCIYKMVHRRPH